MWLLIALVGALGWAVVHVLDAYCVGKVFQQPWFGVITSALCSLPVMLLLPFVVASWPSCRIIALAVAAGALIQFSQLFYFRALNHSEAGIVAAYWNIVPALLPLMSFVLFHSVLTASQYGGIAVLIMASIALCLLDGNRQFRWHSFGLMFLASILQVAAVLLADAVYQQTSFFGGFLLMLTGVVAVGVLPLTVFRVRRALWGSREVLVRAAPLLLAIELVNVLALCASQRAIDLGIPSLVTAVETTIPGHVFLLSLMLFTLGHRFGEARVQIGLAKKLVCVAAMIAGVWFVG